MKKFYSFALISLLLFSALSPLFPQDTVYVSKPRSSETAVVMVQKALDICRLQGSKVLVFPSGRYDFWPKGAAEKLYYESNTDVIPLRSCAILIENMHDLTIDCRSSELIFHGRIQPFTIDRSSNIIVKNVSIDWDIPMTAQAEIMEVNDNYIDIVINTSESPYEIENGKILFTGEGWKSRWNGVMEFEKKTKLIAARTGDDGCLGDGWGNYRATELKKGVIRLNYHFVRKPAIGNYLVLRHSARDHAGTFITESSSITILNMNMFQNAGLGILSQYSSNLTFRKVNCVPNEAKGRIFSGHDDGLHFSNCSGQIIIDSCRFLSLMDDPVNVHGTSVRIMEIKDEKRLLCKFMHEQSIGFTWAVRGDKTGFIENESMSTFGFGTVASFKPLTPELFEITFTGQLPRGLRVGNALENLTKTPDVIIKNSFFGSNRARGILVSTPGDVIIENNIFESSGSAILIPGDANGWYESGAVKNVVIRNNIFRAPCLTSMYQFCEGIISICPEIPKPEIGKPFHRNIRIENNEFHPYDYPVLYVKSVKGLVFTGNKLIRSTAFEPFHHSKSTFTFEYCSDISINNNLFEGDILGRNIYLNNSPASSLRLGSGERLTVKEKPQ